MSYDGIQEIRLALFGASASGKTTFLASYFGNQQRNCFEENHGYRLEAEDVSDGNQLLKRYYSMEAGEFPLGTETFVEYRFGLKVTSLPQPALYVVWYDYPGGWWERTPKDDSEKVARRDAFKKLLTSHVGILLVDGELYVKQGLPYVRHLLDQFRAEARRISDDFAANGNPLEVLPKQWVIAISKADLLPEYETAESICKKIVLGASDQLRGVGSAVNSSSFGHQYLLLSSVRGDDGRVVDAHEFVGLQLVAPIALLSILSELAENTSTGSIYGTFRAIMEKLVSLVGILDKADDFLPLKYQVITKLLKVFGVTDSLEQGVDYFRNKQAIAVKERNALKAAVAAFKADLASDAAHRAFYRNQNDNRMRATK